MTLRRHIIRGKGCQNCRSSDRWACCITLCAFSARGLRLCAVTEELKPGIPCQAVVPGWDRSPQPEKRKGKNRAWLVHVGSGAADNNNGNNYKSNSNYVWPVRAGEWNALASDDTTCFVCTGMCRIKLKADTFPPQEGRVREGAVSDVISSRCQTSPLLTSPRVGEEIIFCESITFEINKKLHHKKSLTFR